MDTALWTMSRWEYEVYVRDLFAAYKANGYKYVEPVPSPDPQAEDKRQKAMEVLEVEEPLTVDRIEKSFRRLVKKNHPDLGGDAPVFQAVIDARALLLSDEGIRREVEE